MHLQETIPVEPAPQVVVEPEPQEQEPIGLYIGRKISLLPDCIAKPLLALLKYIWPGIMTPEELLQLQLQHDVHEILIPDLEQIVRDYVEPGVVEETIQNALREKVAEFPRQQFSFSAYFNAFFEIPTGGNGFAVAMQLFLAFFTMQKYVVKEKEEALNQPLFTPEFRAQLVCPKRQKRLVNTLDLHDIPLTVESFEGLRFFRWNAAKELGAVAGDVPHIKKLILAKCELDREPRPIFDVITTEYRELEELDISENNLVVTTTNHPPLTNSVRIADLMRQLPHLRKLTLTGNQFDDAERLEAEATYGTQLQIVLA